MTTKTDFHSIKELRERYTPAQRGIVNAAEHEVIRVVLELGQRNNIELQNVRDMVVMLYGQWSSLQQKKDNSSEVMKLMDAMSAICCVIDQEKCKRGLSI